MSTINAPQWTIEAMEAGTIDPDAFDHEAHIHVAWLYLERDRPIHEGVTAADSKTGCPRQVQRNHQLVLHAAD